MKKNIKNILFSILTCGLLSTATLGVTLGVSAKADSERVVPTGTYTGTLSGTIADSMLDSFQVYGASTRKSGTVDGLRFLSTIENDDLALIPEGAEFGTILIPNRLLGDEELTKDTAKALVAPAKVDTDAEEVPENGMGYYITLVGETLTSNFPENLYGTVFAARAYVKYTYENAYGEMVEDYAYSAKTIYRSIGYVASCELATLANTGNPDNDENSFLNKIVAEVADQKEMSVSLSEAQINIGKTADVTVSGISDGVNNFAYSLSSSNESVAKIGENGKIEAVGAGTTTITARIGLTERSVELTVTDPDAAEAFTDGNILYSTADDTIFIPNGLLQDGETIVSAKANGVEYFNADGWDALALTDAEITANATKTTTLTIKTSDGEAYNVNAISYAGVIDELKDFENFFSTDHDPSVYPPPTYGHYIIIKNIGTLEDDLAITCSAVPAYSVNKIAGFNGIVDGLGHTVKFNLTKGGLFGSILGNCIIQNLSIVFNDNTPNHYGVFGHWAEQYPKIINCYIAQQNNHYSKTTTYGLMYQPWGRLVLENTVVFGNNFTFSNIAGAGRTNISAASKNAFVIWGRTQVANDQMLTTNFTEVVTDSGALTSDLSVLDSKYWSTTDNKPSWKQAADTAVSVYGEAYQEPTQQVDSKLLYSTKDGAMILPESLQGATIVDAYSEDKALDYYENGAWQNLALTDTELNANATKNTTFVIETDMGNYLVTATSYAGVIDELSDFPVFFNNEATAEGKAPETFGHYIVAKDLGDGTEELALTQCKEINWSANCGFSGILDGQGHTLRFKLTSGGLVGMLLGNATIKNLGVIFEDATTTKYGVFGYFTRLAPVIENCYIEQTNNTGSKTTTFGIMGRPNSKLVLKNTVVYGFNIAMDNNNGAVNISTSSSNAYVIHARSGANNFNFAAGFSIFNDGLEDGSREVLLSEVADASGFNGDYWYKENGKLIWKGLETVNITWVDGDNVTVEPFTKGDVMSFAALEGAYWSKTENGSQATVKDVRPEEDATYYLVSTTKTLTESAYYSTLNNEFFLPTAFTTAESNGFESITSVDGSVVYYENGEWVRSFALTSAQIANNQMTVTPIKINVTDGAYLMTVKSYAGVIDELSDFPAFFNTANATNAAVNTYGYYVVIKNLVSPDEVVTMSHTTGYGYGNSGFLGVLDGMGHTVSCTLKGYLLNNELGNCLIKDIALKIKLRPTGDDPTMSNVGVLADLCQKGTPVIENSYFELLGQAPNYNGDSTWWIMYRSKTNLKLKNVVVHGNMVTKAQADTAFQISANSENAFVVWARSALVGAGQATNFDEVSTSGIIAHSGLSALDSNYWTTTDNKPNWKGAEDAAVDSVGTITVATKPLDVYKIVLPETADTKVNFAKDELVSFFAEATGVTLEVAADNAYATTEAYISIGNTKMYERANLDLGDAHGQGYRIQTVDNALFINAESTLGCVYGVYGLLNELFGYEQFSADCYTLNEVALEVLPAVNVIENPSFNIRYPVSGTITTNDAYAMRMHMSNETYILKAGDYNHNGGMKEFHNTLRILPPSYWKDGDGNKPNWFNDAGTQLCYTAHGNTDDYNAMVAQIVDVMTLLTLNSDSFSTSKCPEAKYITLTIPDNEDYCNCDACAAAYETYGSNTGAVIKLCNDVREGIETWMNNNPAKKRDLTLLFFAYNQYFDAPVTYNETTEKYELNGGLTMRPDVGVWLAGSSYANYYYDINNSMNDDFRVAVQKWADVTEASGSSLCLWTYSLNNADYMIHADMYGENTFYNENAYQFFAEMGVEMYYNQGPWNATETVTAFNRLNIYLDSQMMWDSTQSVTSLTDKYFNAMYGAGASYMKLLYEAENAASRKLFNKDIEGVPNEFNNNTVDKFFRAITQSDVNTWLGYISNAKAAVNADSSLNDEQKARCLAHIDEEWIAVKYWQMSNPYNWSVDEDAALTEFRAVLGYDAETGTYAKDVTIGERYGYTLTQWIENNFSAP